MRFVETDNSGIIGLNESRANISAMHDRYREEYLKLVNESKSTEESYKRNKGILSIGKNSLLVFFKFISRKYRFLGKTGTRFVSFVADKVMERKNKKNEEELQRKKDKLTADYINGEGIFASYEINDPDLVIESIDKMEKDDIEYSK